MTDASMTEVMRFFEYTKVAGSKVVPDVAAFRTDWGKLSDKDKADLKTGLGNGTLTY